MKYIYLPTMIKSLIMINKTRNITLRFTFRKDKLRTLSKIIIQGFLLPEKRVESVVLIFGDVFQEL